MASLQQRQGWFHLLFRYGGKQYSHALKTRDRREAEAQRGSVDRMLMRIRNRELPPPPPEADVPTFLLSGGNPVADTKPGIPSLTLEGLRDRYLQTHAIGALEPKTLVMIEIHFRHLIRHFGEKRSVLTLTSDLLQQYVVERSLSRGKKQQPISPVTIQKDLSALRAAWNWAATS